MVYVYVADVKSLPDPKEVPGCMELLSKERKNKIERLARPEDRRLSLGAGLLLQQTLKKHGFDSQNIFYGENGKPQMEGIYFNLSHSHNMVACAISDKPVGCDIEKIRDIKENIATRFFSEKENAYIKEAEDEKDMFFRLWTIKESYMKMTGQGLKLGLERVQVDFENARVFYKGELCPCYIKEYEVDGYKLSVCAEGEHFADSLEWTEV